MFVCCSGTVFYKNAHPAYLSPHVLPHQEAQHRDGKHQPGEEGADEGGVPVPVLGLLVV